MMRPTPPVVFFIFLSPVCIGKEGLYFIEIGRVDSVLGFGNSGLVLAIFDFL